jgi:hypothetical protein
MKRTLLLIAATLATLFLATISLAATNATGKAPDTQDQEIIRLRDTLRTEAQRKQFRQALEMAPKTFFCEEYRADGKSYATAHKLRFNESMRRVLRTVDFIREDEFLHKQLRRLYFVTRPFGVTGDITVRYKPVPTGLAVEYEISNLYIWGHRASNRLIRELLKANSNNGAK